MLIYCRNKLIVWLSSDGLSTLATQSLDSPAQREIKTRHWEWTELYQPYIDCQETPSSGIYMQSPR